MNCPKTRQAQRIACRHAAREADRRQLGRKMDKLAGELDDVAKDFSELSMAYHQSQVRKMAGQLRKLKPPKEDKR